MPIDPQNEVILIVDDDIPLQKLLVQYLSEQGIEAFAVADGQEMDDFLKHTQPNLIILDLMLPGEDGLSIARRLRTKVSIPIIILSAKGDELDKIIGLEVGADDYVSKPFNPRELLARLRAVLRRSSLTQDTLDAVNDTSSEVFFGEFSLNLNLKILSRGEEELDLTSGEMSLLLIFAQNPNQILSRDKLMDLTQIDNDDSFDRSIDVRITRLRKKLGDSSSKPRFIRTVWGEGYRFTPTQ